MGQRPRNTVARWRLLQVASVLALVSLITTVALPARSVTVVYRPPPVVDPITYTLPDGTVVVIERAVAVVATIALEECARSGLGIADRLRSVLGVAPALAGHDVAAAPGEFRGPLVLELVGPGADVADAASNGTSPSTGLGSGTGQAWTFCRGHIAFGQSRSDVEAGVRGARGEDLAGLSLRLTGTVTGVSGSGVSGVEPFVVESHRSHGGFIPIESPIRITSEQTLEIGFALDRTLIGLDPGDPAAGDLALEALVGGASLGP